MPVKRTEKKIQWTGSGQKNNDGPGPLLQAKGEVPVGTLRKTRCNGQSVNHIWAVTYGTSREPPLQR